MIPTADFWADQEARQWLYENAERIAEALYKLRGRPLRDFFQVVIA